MIRLRIGVLACAAAWASLPAGLMAEADLPVWEEATGVYKAAISQYQAGKYPQAQGLLEDFVRRFPTHEEVPGAYLKLARCRAVQNDFTGSTDALDQVIRRFYGTPDWLVAYAAKLQGAKVLRDEARAAAEAAKKKAAEEAKKQAAQGAGTMPADLKPPSPATAQGAVEEPEDAGARHSLEYFNLLEQMVRRCRQLPLKLTADIGSMHHQRSWYYIYDAVPQPQYGYYLVSVLRQPAWVIQIAEMADKPLLAERALRALAYTFKRHENDLPADWQFAHVALLEAAGKHEQAAPLLESYVGACGDDPRGMILWLRKAQWAEDHGDEKTADDCYAQLVKAYGGCLTLDELLGARLGHLRQKNRSEPFFTLARYYLKTYPQGRYGGSIVIWWTQLAQPAILAGEKALQDETTTLVDEFQGADSLSALRWKLDLAIAGKKFDLAGELGRRMLEDRYWSAGMFDVIRHYARQAETLKDLEAAARKKYGIPDQDPQSKAAAMYKELKGRIQDDQQRHMEQIGLEIFSDCRDDYWTIEAVWELVNYYFRKVMPEPRDEWIKRMVSAWPRHPRTQSVLHMWIVADRAANRYDRLAEAIDLYRASFPGGDSYYHDRLSCYDAAKDEEGRLAYVRSYFGPGAVRGDFHAIEQLANYELAALPEQTGEALGAYWTDLARKHAGTRAELYCLHRALEYLHYRPYYYKHLGLNVRWDDALAVVKRLQQQKIDPEIAWDVAFLDVTLLAQKPDAAAAVAALNTALGNKRKVRDLAPRVNLADLGKALGEGKMIRQGGELAERLRKACWTAADLDGINSMLGAMYHYGGAPLVAARYYAAVVDADPWPVRKQGTMMHALRLLGSDAQLYSGAAEQYVRKIAGAQGVIPEMLLEVGQYHLNRSSGVVMQVLGQLRQQYPASSFRGRLEVMVAEAARRAAGGNR